MASSTFIFQFCTSINIASVEFWWLLFIKAELEKRPSNSRTYNEALVITLLWHVQSRVSSYPLLNTDEAAGNEMEDGPNHPRKPRPRKKKPSQYCLGWIW
jgi:hypothetical protein